MTQALVNWRTFWVLWLTGIVILVALISQNDRLVTDIAPQGMVDHQVAASAKRVEDIHESWHAVGAMGFFRMAILFDLLFIVLYSAGGVMGGVLIGRDARSSWLKALGGTAILAYAAFGMFDITETLCQAFQGFVTGGNDLLAGMAARAQPPKMVAFFVGFPSLVAALVWFRLENARGA